VGDALAQVGTAAASVLALVLSLANLYLQRRDRSPRLRIRVRYEYRAGTSEGSSRDIPGGGRPPPRIHDGSQEGLYLLLGDLPVVEIYRQRVEPEALGRGEQLARRHINPSGPGACP
jgi:hypothetical protein